MKCFRASVTCPVPRFGPNERLVPHIGMDL